MAYKILYTYHTFMEALKILKHRGHLSLYDIFNKSVRKEITLIASLPTNDFISRLTTIWHIIAPKLKVVEHAYDMISWTDNKFDMNQIAMR